MAEGKTITKNGLAEPTNWGLIGRGFTPVWDPKKKEIIKFTLEVRDPLLIDFSLKQHTYIVAKSGGGKSYLAGVDAEELIRTAINHAVIILDPTGIFPTLGQPNNPMEVKAWNDQLPGPDVIAEGMTKFQIWIPAGDIPQFQGLKYDRVFALKPRDFSYGTLCYAFDMEVLDPQVNLYRKVMHILLKKNPDYSLSDLICFVREEGQGLNFYPQTIDALVTKLDALAELGIIANDGIEIHEMIRPGEIAIFDLSMSSTYTAKILVNFLAEKILLLRKRVTKKVNQARIEEKLIEKPGWYIPPVHFLIDEAHNFMPRNDVLKKCIKEGRNCGMMITAISQSPDLTRDVYTNITHLYVGPMVFDDDINAIKAMIPIEKKPQEFRKQIKQLTTGCFWYYNIDKKLEKCIRVRPRRTLHPASTELEDERKYFIENRHLRDFAVCEEIEEEEEDEGEDPPEEILAEPVADPEKEIDAMGYLATASYTPTVEELPAHLKKELPGLVAAKKIQVVSDPNDHEFILLQEEAPHA